MRLPTGGARVALAGAAAAWVGAVAGLAGGAAIAGAAAAAAAVAWRRQAVVVGIAGVCAAAALSGALAAARQAATLSAAVPAGPQVITGRMATDPREGDRGFRFVLTPTHLGTERWAGPALLVETPGVPGASAGEPVRVRGEVSDRSGWERANPVAGRIRARAVERLGPAGDPLFRAGNAVRRRIQGGLDPGDPAAALLTGFLIGDVSGLADRDEDALRRAGLTHFVAVSGSNVALFLAAWWVAGGPLAATPRRRAAFGLAGLALFVVVTRWEPSVVRAATMAGTVLAGRLAGIVVDAWAALGVAVTVLLLVSAGLVAEVGFQLSVAATAGVLAGAGLGAGRRPRWLWGILGATLAAQVAVAPILLWRFGTVPLLAPLANVAVGPLVAFATSVGGVGVLTGFAPAVGLARLAARGVLAVAKVAAAWPQLGPGAAAAAGLLLALAARRGLRPALAVVAALVVLVTALPRPPPARPTVTFLDVGQGDAVLLRDPTGAAVLVDGGPEPGVLLGALAARGVRRIDLMVATHGHADHVSGLAAAAAELPVAMLWHPGHPEPGPLLEGLLVTAAARGASVLVPPLGTRAQVGQFSIEVLGPRRRYASPNDQSLVMRVAAGGTDVLLAGDTEAVAQAELGPLPADVLKVPHQGAATSDLGWLAASAPRLAVISVGPNPFGHPSPDVVATLEAAGSQVVRTDEEGDIELALPWPP